MSEIIHPFGGKKISVEADFCGRKLSIETGRVAFLADGAVLVRYGETIVMGTAVVSKTVNEGQDYFPMLVDYEERMYATGKISGSRYIKREGKASDKATLIARLIDRPIRPLFPKGYRNEVQAVATVLSADQTYSTEVVAMIAVSAALTLTGAPFDGPVAGVKIGMKEGKLIAMPTTEELEQGQLDLSVAGTADAIMMVEAGAQEVSEEDMIKAIELAHKSIQPVIAAQAELAKKAKVEAQEYKLELTDQTLAERVAAYLQPQLGPAVRHEDYYRRHQAIRNLKEATMAHFEQNEDWEAVDVDLAFEEALKKEVRRAILEEGIRPDNRKFDEVRPLSSQVGVLPRTHGSAIFTRGTTQALNVTTLAPPSFSQQIDTMEEDTTKRFMHHYNFPGYSTGEVRPMRSPGRREIGHGALAERALEAVLPPLEEFPYAIRSVSEILTSNGSTSMASVCSGCLSLMDAGVPLTNPVSGIAMGLVMGEKQQVVLSDIAGEEDFAGDMDFKVAGTPKGITALQMDIKVKGITPKLMNTALAQAKTGRNHILKHMLSVLAGPRKELSSNAPRISKLQINPDKIRDVIGKGGETINKIIADTGAQIDIEDSGLVLVSAVDAKAAEAALETIKGIVAEPEIGQVYDGTVVKVMDFGAFVEILPGKDGLVHISELADGHVDKVTDVVNEGDKIRVKLVNIDDRGRLNLSKKIVDQPKK